MGQAAQLSNTKRRLLDQYLRGKTENTWSQSDQIRRRPEGAIAPLCLSQEELWLREPRTPDGAPLHNECVRLHLAGPLDVAVLERSFSELIRRHEIWRTTFETVGGQVVQIIHPAAPVRLPVVDLRDFPKAHREEEALRYMSADVRRPFQFQTGPALRPTLIRIDDNEYCLFLAAHLIVLDGMSAYQIFPSELSILYRAFLADQPSPLPEPVIQYADFACWQREWFQGQVFKRQMDYWREQLEDVLPIITWPGKTLVPASGRFRGAIRPFELSRRLAARVKELSQREKSTLFSILLSGFAALLHFYTTQTDIVVGTLSPSGRKRTEVLKLLGYFLNPVALRLSFERDPTFRDLLIQARTVLSEAMSNDDIPIGVLARELKPELDSSSNPLLRVAISLQPPMPNLDLPWSVTSMDVESGGSPWDLYLAFIERPWGIIGRVQFNPEVFAEGAIAQLLRDFEILLESLVTSPSQRVSEAKFVRSVTGFNEGAC